MNSEKKVTGTILVRLMSILGEGEPEDGPGGRRRRLTAWLTTHKAAEIPAEAWPLLQELWERESTAKSFQHAADLPRLTSNRRWTDAVSLWRGDITRLGAGATVNAANAGLTGCYVPFHACVDNVIHTAAGPWLRTACEQIMSFRGRPEPTGTVTVTPGFYLPARHVLHTVGPCCRSGSPSPEDEAALGRCYCRCLETARDLGLASIGFCAISTGIFGYPKREAALVSLRAIRQFQTTHEGALHVILVAFTSLDELTYGEALEEIPQ